MAEQWRADPFKYYRLYVMSRLDIGEGPAIRSMRELISESGEDSGELRTLDAVVIESIIVAEYINPMILKDDPDQPLSHWWWHLGALRAGTFPLDQLPDHLVPVFHTALNDLAQNLRDQADEVHRTIALGATGFRTIRLLLRDGKPDEALELAEALHNLPMPDDKDQQQWTRWELTGYLDAHPEQRILLAVASLDHWTTER